MKVYFITYSDIKYRELQNNLIKRAKEYCNFDEVVPYTREWLEQTQFYNDNRQVLDFPKWGGCCCWKPYIILDCINKVDEGDVVFYMDCSDDFSSKGATEYIKSYLSNKDIMLTHGGLFNGLFTRKRCFLEMGCDNPNYWLTPQLEAGVLAFKKTSNSINFLNEWLKFCCNAKCSLDVKDPYVEEFEEYIEHRADQSILTNLRVKHNIPVQNDIRRYVHVDKNNPKPPINIDSVPLSKKFYLKVTNGLI